MTEPLVPPEVDLTDFAFMPVQIARLKQSRAWLLCKRHPELAFYMLNLWTASWHRRPCASLEDDDLVLADLAMCNDKVWPKIKADVMRGWIKCSDDLFYHPIVAEHAVEAWARKSAQRARTEAAREAKKQAITNKPNGVTKPSHKAMESATENVTTAVTASVTENVTASKGQGQGQGQGQEKRALRARKEKHLSQIPDDLDLDLDRRAAATKCGLRPEAHDGEFAKFVDHHKAKGSKMLDWNAAWRTWARNSVRYGANDRAPTNGRLFPLTA